MTEATPLYTDTQYKAIPRAKQNGKVKRVTVTVTPTIHNIILWQMPVDGHLGVGRKCEESPLMLMSAKKYSP